MNTKLTMSITNINSVVSSYRVIVLCVMQLIIFKRKKNGNSTLNIVFFEISEKTILFFYRTTKLKYVYNKETIADIN